MGRSRRVIFDVPGNGGGFEGIAQPVEQGLQFLLGKQIKEHQHVGLFGELVTVRGIPFSFQNTVQPVDVPVSLPVAFPIKFRQCLISFELTDDPLVMKRHEHLLADVFPQGDLGGTDVQEVPHFGSARRREPVQEFQSPAQNPYDHEIGIRVVVQARGLGIRILIVVFIGSHHPQNLIAFLVGIV